MEVISSTFGTELDIAAFIVQVIWKACAVLGIMLRKSIEDTSSIVMSVRSRSFTCLRKCFRTVSQFDKSSAMVRFMRLRSSFCFVVNEED